MSGNVELLSLSDATRLASGLRRYSLQGGVSITAGYPQLEYCAISVHLHDAVDY